jgi:5-methylcytosine-specific restriction endonuclease McrA
MPTINRNSPRRPWQPERKPFESTQDNQRFYNSAAWRNLAKRHKMANPLCVNFDTCGVAHYTDHIEPISEGGTRMDWGNLQSLCVGCNASKTGKQAHKKKST